MTAQHPQKPFGLIHTYLAQQQTMPIPGIHIPETPPLAMETTEQPVVPVITISTRLKRVNITHIAAFAMLLMLALVLYFIWHPDSSADSSTPITQQDFGNLSTQTGNTGHPSTSTGAGTTIQVYIAGAVQNPGVYTMDVNARTYELLKAAGGALPHANLASINLAARLTDGQEIYISLIGETPPASLAGDGSGTAQDPLVNINSASADELRQQLQISSKTAQAIVNYRLQHGPFTSVNELSHVVSTSIYNKIKDLVTVS